jgi:hypothetical protein
MRYPSWQKRAHLYEVWRAIPASVMSMITYPALKVILFYDSTIPLISDGFSMLKHCSTKTPNTEVSKVTVALFESGCIIITGSIMPEDASSGSPAHHR